MNRTPRVSVGVPVYNAEKYLRQSLESLLAQTFEDVEIIISDNCSADATEAICREFAQRDSRIRYLRQPENLGAIANFNHVFAEARGEYFKWAAYDDLCEPTFLQRCVDVLDKNPDVGWCHSKSDRIDADGGRLTVPSLAGGRQLGVPATMLKDAGTLAKTAIRAARVSGLLE